MKDLYKENYKTQKKEIKEGNRRWKNQSTDSMQLVILIKIPMQFLHRNWKKDLKVYMETQKDPGYSKNLE